MLRENTIGDKLCPGEGGVGLDDELNVILGDVRVAQSGPVRPRPELGRIRPDRDSGVMLSKQNYAARR